MVGGDVRRYRPRHLVMDGSPGSLLPWRRSLGEAVLCALPCVVLWWLLGAAHREAELALAYNDFFWSDPSMNAEAMARGAVLPRRWLHPLIAPLVGLPGRGLMALGLSRDVVACGLVHCGGFVSLVLWHLLLRTAGAPWYLRALGTALLGLSFSTLCSAVLPEVHVFGTAVLLLACLLAMRGCGNVAAIGSAALCAGTTVTNLGAWCCIQAAGMRWAALPRLIGQAVLGALLCAAVFTGYEALNGSLGSLRLDVGGEVKWLRKEGAPLDRIVSLGDNVLAPPVLLLPKTLAVPAAFEQVMAFGKLGTALAVNTDPLRMPAWPTVLAWLGLLAACMPRLQPSGPARRLALVLLANLLWHTPVHVIYGDADVSYSMHWTFSLIAGPLLLAIGRPKWTAVFLAALVAVIGLVNVRTAFDLAEAHRAWRDTGWRLQVTAAGEPRQFTASGRIGLDRGSVRPFLLYPDPRRSERPGAANDTWLLPPYSMAPEELLILGEGTASGGSFSASGKVARDPAGRPLWISLLVSGTWRDFRVGGFTFPQRL